MGIERSTRFTEVNTGLGLGAEAGHPLIKEMLDDYADIHFLLPDGTYDITTCTVKNTAVLRRHGYVDEDRTQSVAGATVFASEYFSPMEMESGIIKKSRNTYTVHHYSLSWTTDEKRAARRKSLKKIKRANFFYNIKVLPNKILRKLLGDSRYERLREKRGK